MLENLSEKIRECYQLAHDCERQAIVHAAEPALQKDFLDTAGRWLKLARSYEFAERLQRFPKAKP